MIDEQQIPAHLLPENQKAEEPQTPTEHIPMASSLRKRWVEALRSGKYKQGVGVLHDPSTDSYCCLGVLAHVAGRTITRTPGTDTEQVNGYPAKGNFLPVKIAAELGITMAAMEYFAGANDDEIPFSDLANEIETWEF